MAVRTVLKQTEKNSQREQGEKGWACYYSGKESHPKRDCPQASKPHLPPWPVCKEPHWRIDCPRGIGQGSDSQDNQDWRCLWFPTQVPILITHEESQVLIPVGGGQYFDIPFCVYWRPWPTFSLSHFCNRTVWTSQTLLFQSFSNLQLRLCYFHRRFWSCQSFPHPFGEGYAEQGPCLCCHEYGALFFSPFNWTKCKS